MKDLAKLVFDLQNEKIELEKRSVEIDKVLECIGIMESQLLGSNSEWFTEYEQILGDMRLRRGDYSETNPDK